jgi:hypothetical protein
MSTASVLRVLSVPHPPQGPSVKIKQEHLDHPNPPQADQRTSIRFFTNDVRTLEPRPHFPLDPGPYHSPRDRDLGQTFTTPPGPPFRLTAITLRTGPALKAVGTDAPGAAVSLQLFAVSGTPVIREISGNPTLDDHDPSRDRRADYITGESYESLWVVSGGVLPVPLWKDQWLRWQFPDDAPVLQPGQRYAFLVMFDEPAPARELALANLYHGPADFGGHGIRREGSVAQPWLDTSWVNSREASSLPLSRAVRLAQQPGTWGRPDVDTYRVLTLFIEGI